MHISTVRITSAETVSGFIVINEADFDPSKHQIWNSEVTVATPEPSSAEPNANKSLDLMTLAELRDHAKAHGDRPSPRRSPPRPTYWPMSSLPATPPPQTEPSSRRRNHLATERTVMACGTKKRSAGASSPHPAL